MPKKIVRCTVNGVKREYFIDVRLSLLEMLREEAGLDSVKHGCNVGECGACTVLIDGLTYNACIYLAVWAEGKTIITLEGLNDKTGAISDIQQAFIDEGAVFDKEGKQVTVGGRNVTIVGIADNIIEANKQAYDYIESVKFKGSWYRKDIGNKFFEN
jgi:hypothetical protein